MADHAARDHATWSASATARNWFCPGALALAAHAPPDKEEHPFGPGNGLPPDCGEVPAYRRRPVIVPRHRREDQRARDRDRRGARRLGLGLCRVRAQRDGTDAILDIEQRFSLARSEAAVRRGRDGRRGHPR
jgi:hypothetical protein